MEKHILAAELRASSGAKKCAEPYRAAVVRGDRGAVIEIQQPIRGEWYGCGRWALSTLLDKGVERVSDALSIDYGQNWQIDSGMRQAITEACTLLAGMHSTE